MTRSTADNRNGNFCLRLTIRQEPARCLVSGTGLTHLGSARNRQSMHASTEADLTDSMKMFRWGIEGGRPAPGSIGTAPEWFYKGTGTSLRATRRGARSSGLRRRWRRGGGDCRHLSDRSRTASRTASEWQQATNFQTTYSRRRTISTWRRPSFAPARSDLNLS